MRSSRIRIAALVATPEVLRQPALKAPSDGEKLPFLTRAQLATAAAWSPNPNNPPLYLDLPTKDGAPQPDILAKWAANSPLAFVDQYPGTHTSKVADRFQNHVLKFFGRNLCFEAGCR